MNRKFLMTNLNSDADTFDDLTADPNNWRYLPLSRLRARDPLAQHALGDD